ncbi:AraC family transcriptional regulator [Paenibacillus gorillae]|uniref:AraC family transcriptional regulator n=1 Tax=Paenibacillus gorillae TaxID=1243662 RepID=UPI0004B18DB0|nr:AraC family transcriptional regulator [Paenibacillus gorillae]
MSVSIQKKQRKFLRMMYVWITLTMLLVLSLFATSTYYSAREALLKNEYTSNKKILSQVKFNIDYMDEMIRNAVLSLFYNPDVQTILYNDSLDFGETLKEINIVRASIVNSNPFINSIYFYNNSSKMYYSTGEDLLFQDKSLNAMFDSGKALPILKPIPRSIEHAMAGEQKRYENVVTYFMYEFTTDNNLPNGALIVNARTNWILNNIKMINNTDLEKQDPIMILDGDGALVGDSLEEDSFLLNLKATYMHQQAAEKDKNEAKETTGYFISDIADKKYLITYAYVENMNWTIVKAQPYQEVVGKITSLKYTFFLITGGFLLIAFMISLSLSRRFYKPIDRLVRQVVMTDRNSGMPKGEDEFTYLNDVFQTAIDKMNHYKQRSHTSQEVMRAYFLRKLLVDSIGVEEFAQAKSDFGIRLNPDQSFLICIVKIDCYKQFKEKYTPRDQALYLYGIENVTSECIGESFPCEVVNMKGEYIAFIMNSHSDTDSLRILTERCKQAQSYIMEYYHLSISMCISEPIENYTDLSNKHYETLNNSLYRLIFGHFSVLTPQQIRKNADNPQLGYSASLEKKLIDGLKTRSIPIIEDTLSRIFREIAALNYNHALLSIMNLLNVLKMTVEEISRVKLEPIHVNFNLITKQLFELETLTELHESIMQLFVDMNSKTDVIENEKQSIIVETMKELIDAEYANSELCLQFVSSKLNISSKSASKLFSSRMNMSVADYINDVRLNKAVEWLESSGLNIKEILVKIGVENESYFYKLFKKKYGATPKEYVLSKSVKQILNK